MKRTLLLAGLFAGWSAAAGVRLVSGQTDVVVAPDACPVVRFAADEAATFLSQALGEKVPVVTAPTGGRTSLIVGPNRWAEAAGVTTNGLDRDFYRIRTTDSCVFVIGRDDPKADPHVLLKSRGESSQRVERATVFGVYEFLERFAGVRFYFPGELGTLVPKTDEVAVPDVDLTDGPANPVRRYCLYNGGVWFEGEKPDAKMHPMKTLNWWRLRMETAYVPCCHGQNRFRYMDRFAKTHPEYFALLPDGRRHNSPRITYPGHPGQLCHTSVVWEEIYQDAKSYLLGEDAAVRGIPGGWGVNCQGRRYVDIMPQDGMIKCACLRCQAYYATQSEVGWASDLTWSNVVTVAKRLKAEGVPGRVTMMAYSKYRKVPAFDIPDNVDVMVAERGPFAADDPKEWNREIDEVKAWYEKLGGRKVWMWTYVHKYRKLWQPGIILMTPRALARYFRTLAPYIFGAYIENETDRAFPELLNEYVFAKVMWNPQTDVEALLDEYVRLMFGAAAPEMARFIARCEDIWIRELAGKTVDTADGPLSQAPTPEAMYTTIYSPAVIAEFEALFAAAERKVAADAPEGRRLALMRRETLDELKGAIAAFQAKRAAFAAFRVTAGKDAAHRILVDQVVNKNRVRSTAPVKTWVNVWREGGKLHAVFDCEEPRMDETVAAVRAPGDANFWTDNGVELYVNPSGDRKRVFQFSLNAAGTTRVQVHPRKNATARAPAFEARAERTAGGWRGEFAIPLADLPGLRDAAPMNFRRCRGLKSGATDILWGDYPETGWDFKNFGTVVLDKEEKAE